MTDNLTFINPPQNIPGSFDFPVAYRAQGFLLYQPLSYRQPQLLAGWNRLVAAFSAAMSELDDLPGAWADQSIAAYYLTTTAYEMWRWSNGPAVLPTFLAVPYANLGDPARPPFAANPQPQAAVFIYAVGTPIPAAFLDGQSQGLW